MALVNASIFDASCSKTILNEDDDRTTVRVLYGHVVAKASERLAVWVIIFMWLTAAGCSSSTQS